VSFAKQKAIRILRKDYRCCNCD